MDSEGCPLSSHLNGGLSAVLSVQDGPAVTGHVFAPGAAPRSMEVFLLPAGTCQVVNSTQTMTTRRIKPLQLFVL